MKRMELKQLPDNVVFPRGRWKRRRNSGVTVLLAILLLLVIMPFFSILLASLKEPAELVKGVFALPEKWLWSNYVDAWYGARFNKYLMNSLVVVGITIPISILFSVLSSYAFGRMEFRYSKVLFFLFLVGIIVPQEGYIIPLYHWMRRIGFYNTYWAMILPQIGMSVCFGTFWLSGYFRSFPRELVDSAKLDGCNDWSALWRVIFPNSFSVITTLIVLFFVWTWNDFMIPLVLVSSDELRTLPLGLAFFQGRYSANIPLIAAGATIVTLPSIIIYILFQRHFIRGITSGALTGQ